MINNKIILNIHYSQNIKFKIAFDHQNNTALFSHLKAILVERLEQIKKSSPEVIQQEFPPSFQIKEFSLKDKDGFDYFDNDEVTQFCSPNDEIKLFYLGNIISSQSQLDVTTQSQTQTQTTIKNVQASVVQNQQPQGDQYIPILQAQVPAQPAPQIPAMTNQIAPQIANQTQAQKVLNVVPQQQQGGVMSEEQLEKLKDEFYLDTSNLDKVQGLMGEVKFQLIFPQAKDNKKQFEFWSESNKTLYELSQQILSALKLPQNYSVTLFTHMGQALTKSLNQYFTSTVQETIELTINKTFYAIISQTACGERTFEKIDSDLGTDQIFVLHQGPKVIKIDILKDTVKILKQKIYHKLDIPTHIQSLNYGGKVLQDDIVLSEYNISQNSNINLSFRMNQIVSPADSYDFNFYNPWLKHLRPQTEEGQRQLRNHLLVLFSNLQEPKFLALLRILTNNNAFVLIIKHLMRKRRLNQLQRIVLEEGFVTLFFNILIHNKKVKKDFQIESILEYTRICLGNLLKQQKNIKLDQKQISNLEKYKLFEERCSITMKPIVRAGLFQTKKDQPMDQWCIVDFDQIALKQQTDEEIYDIPFKQLSLIEPDWLKDQYLYSKSYTNDFYAWCPVEQYDQQFIDLNIDEDIFENKVENDIAGFCKIHSAAELKQHPPTPALTKNAEKKLVIYTSMNKDVNKPINLTDIMNGQIYSENPDNLVAGQAVKGKVIVTPGNDSDDDEEVVDNKLIAQITAPFDEAIVVLVDISGSMDEQFFESKGLTRLGAVKAFFNAFADRTMAYNLKNVISLAYFEEKYYKKCGFTEAFMHFKDLVNEAKTRGKTALFTALKEAVDSLVKLREQYPHMMARIIALTDGEDNASKIQAMEVSQLIVKNNIVLDSFVVSDSCKDLHVITKSIGGKCFRPITVQQGLSLFEYETILTARNREEEGVKPTQITTLNNFMKLKSEKQIKFDEQPYGLKLPVQIQRGSVNGQMLVNQISQNAQNLQVFAPSATLKRVMKEILDYEVKPHPFVRIFPCKDDIAFWKLILLGPENTPYYGGVYTLYIKFPSDYPQKPPEVRFLTPIYHCNINAQGRICHSVLDRNYSPDLRVIQIIQQIYGLLMTPEPDDPLDTVIASLYIQDLQTYMTKATQHTKAHANRPLDEVMNQILGQGAEQLNISDIEIQQKVQEIHEWINSQNQGQQ